MKFQSFEHVLPYPKSFGFIPYISKILCCKTGKLFYIKCILVAVIIACVGILYIMTTAMGYWTTFFFENFQYNMTTGYPLNYNYSKNISNNTINIVLTCHNDQRYGFYGGCFGIGIIVDIVFVILCILFYKTGQLFSNIFPHCYEIAEYLYDNDDSFTRVSDGVINTDEIKNLLSSEFDSDHLVFETGCRSENDIRIATFPEKFD